jgi:hypothetical protein
MIHDAACARVRAAACRATSRLQRCSQARHSADRYPSRAVSNPLGLPRTTYEGVLPVMWLLLRLHVHDASPPGPPMPRRQCPGCLLGACDSHSELEMQQPLKRQPLRT